jgi:GNAT superfamily N-acetyltransferase
MCNITLRPWRIEDAPALAILMTQLGYPTSDAQMRRRLESLAADEAWRAIVAEHGGAVVGMIGLHVARGFEFDGVRGQIAALVVDERLRRKGVGRLLVAAGEEWLGQRGARKVTVTSAHRRKDTHRFYEQLGYESTGLRFAKPLRPVVEQPANSNISP